MDSRLHRRPARPRSSSTRRRKRTPVARSASSRRFSSNRTSSGRPLRPLPGGVDQRPGGGREPVAATGGHLGGREVGAGHHTPRAAAPALRMGEPHVRRQTGGDRETPQPGSRRVTERRGGSGERARDGEDVELVPSSGRLDRSQVGGGDERATPQPHPGTGSDRAPDLPLGDPRSRQLGDGEQPEPRRGGDPDGAWEQGVPPAMVDGPPVSARSSPVPVDGSPAGGRRPAPRLPSGRAASATGGSGCAPAYRSPGRLSPSTGG